MFTLGMWPELQFEANFTRLPDSSIQLHSSVNLVEDCASAPKEISPSRHRNFAMITQNVRILTKMPNLLSLSLWHFADYLYRRVLFLNCICHLLLRVVKLNNAQTCKSFPRDLSCMWSILLVSLKIHARIYIFNRVFATSAERDEWQRGLVAYYDANKCYFNGSLYF